MAKFDINDYSGDVVMHCPDKKSAEIFLEYLDSVGKTWTSGERYIYKDYWDDYSEDTCYEFLEGMHDGYSWYEDEDFEILEFDDFEWDEINSMELEPAMSFEDLFAPQLETR